MTPDDRRRSWRTPALDALLVTATVGEAGYGFQTGRPFEVAYVAYGVLAGLALLLRRRRPRTVLALVLPAATLVPVYVAPTAALFAHAQRSRNRWLMAAVAVAFAAAATEPWPPVAADLTSPITLITFALWLALGAAATLQGQLVQARREAVERLAEIEQARDQERRLHAENVLARERARLAREMHDVVSHQVSLIAVQAGALQVNTQDPRVRETARAIRRLSVDTLDELRHMVTLLRASGGRATELAPQPTLADLRRLVADSGIDAHLDGDLPADLPPPVQRAVYRTVQEALTNVRKHAPGASATIRLDRTGATLEVTVTNTPPTRPVLPLPGAHHGLVGLRERAEILDGTFHAAPTPGGGYAVTTRIPVPDPPIG